MMKWPVKFLLVSIAVLLFASAIELKQRAFSADFSNLPNYYEYQITPVSFNYPANWKMIPPGGKEVPRLSEEEIRKEREYYGQVGETIILWTPVRLKENGQPDPDVRVLGTLYINQPLPETYEMKNIGEIYAYPQTSEYSYLHYRTRIKSNFLGTATHGQSIIDDYTLKIGTDLISIWVSYKDEETLKKVRPEVEQMMKSFRPRERK